jgi:hypothetical protein
MFAPALCTNAERAVLFCFETCSAALTHDQVRWQLQSNIAGQVTNGVLGHLRALRPSRIEKG